MSMGIGSGVRGIYLWFSSKHDCTDYLINLFIWLLIKWVWGLCRKLFAWLSNDGARSVQKTKGKCFPIQTKETKLIRDLLCRLWFLPSLLLSLLQNTINLIGNQNVGGGGQLIYCPILLKMWGHVPPVPHQSMPEQVNLTGSFYSALTPMVLSP